MQKMIGKTISHYKITEKLGAGGMGTVYKAEDTRLDRFVALKFLPPHLSQDEESKQRFIHEAKAASALNHPNIATIYEIDEADGQMFIAMEYIEGKSLQEIVGANDRSPLPIELALDYAIQIAEGLAKAHAKGIIHRDIKPANILVSKDGLVKIVDFGLAKLAGRTMLTKEDTTLGTVAYMSPEQTQGAEVDHRTDIWALGVILYEMLSGQLPFRGDYDQAIIYSILNEAPEALSELRPDIPEELIHLVEKALAKEPDERYDSAPTLLKDLTALSSETPTGGTTVTEASGRQPPVNENSVAVIDFANFSNDESVDWLCGGIAESVTVDLQKIVSLKVVSREKLSKMMAQFQNEKITEQQIIDLGSRLGVRWLVWGSFQKMGPAIRITAHFTEVATGNVAGSTKVDGVMDDIFKLQDQIVSGLMDTLKLELSPSEMKKIESPETLQVEAYEYYARGRQLFNQFGKASFEEAQRLFEQAIEADATYALAYSGLGSIHIFRFIENTNPRDLDNGISNLQKAIKYDPDLVEPYLWLTYAYTRKERLADAIKAGRQAVERDEDNFMSHYFLGAAYLARTLRDYDIERYAEAEEHLNRSIKLQPNYEAGRMLLAWIYLLRGDYTSAREHLEKAVELEESEKFEGVKFVGALTLMGNLCVRQQELESAVDFYERSLKILLTSDHLYAKPFTALTYCGLGQAALQRRQYDQALVHFKKGIDIIEKHPKALGVGYFLVYARLGMAVAFRKLGMKREADQQFQAALRLFNNKKDYDFSLIWEGSDAQLHYDFAGYHALLNERKEALSHLRKAIACGWADLPYWQVDENFSKFRKEAVFLELVQKLESKKS